MEESERTLAALTAAPDALEVLAEMNKKRELRSVDHGSVEYLTVRKNLYTVPRSLAGLTPEEVAARRARIGVRVRGRGAPAPVSTPTTLRMPVFGAHFRPSSSEMSRCVRLKTIMT